MKKTLLKFPSAMYLIAFRRYSKASFWEIDLAALTALCDCSAKDIKIACKDFQAHVLPTPAIMNAVTNDAMSDVRNEPYRILPKTEIYTAV
jgi:hypothetical protein